ncbi:MAG TPA: hypothetical protein VHM23_13120 [Actinomycetota bacterium]|nr:hypothetical protein [Actinomycetota bacterium]
MDGRGRLRLQELRAAVDARLARVPELRRRIRWTGFGQGRPAVVDNGSSPSYVTGSGDAVADLDTLAGGVADDLDRLGAEWPVVAGMA